MTPSPILLLKIHHDQMVVTLLNAVQRTIFANQSVNTADRINGFTEKQRFNKAGKTVYRRMESEAIP